jgi:hypothetical protein
VVTLEVTGHHSLPGEADPGEGPDGGPGDGPSVA